VHTATGRLVELKLGREDATGAETVLSVWPPGSGYAGALKSAEVAAARICTRLGSAVIANGDVKE